MWSDKKYLLAYESPNRQALHPFITGAAIVISAFVIGGFWHILNDIRSMRSAASSGRAPSSVSYVMELRDVRQKVVGHGSGPHEARKDAASKCFEARLDAYERTRGDLNEEVGHELLESCVNQAWQNSPKS